MKIYIMTDMEGVCGVVNHDDWVTRQGIYYEEGKRLLTAEVNAAIAGFAAAGATEIRVMDGHGYGGINNVLLDRRASYVRGPSPYPDPYPFTLDASFDAMAWVGQHAKAGTEYAHMAHTGWFNVLDYQINGISIGEFGQMAMCGAALGVRSIFGAGDEAFAQEAAALVNGIETVSVKRGFIPGSGDAYNTEGYKERNNGAIHMHPEVACELIRAGAERALRRFTEDREQFALLQLQAPYRREIRYRSDGTKAAYTHYSEHPDSVIDLLNGK
ncbi:M55 family metallopeptidase [Paenibacillus eucommiae]|uniref:D-amino peptidase n=1 Tax=Paenibacillus eucommiae TaxID=1355755 RepID=A0ABS4IWK8_9BACL|nr:M55 family metallopeptidase [Paenibacillus eucommiae]MBP1991465.1 D-amino peptidase [Paenibacillus eucommiae]